MCDRGKGVVSRRTKRAAELILRALSPFAVSFAVACSADEPRRDPRSAQVVQDIQIADLIGPSSTGFFPVGFFTEGHQVDVPEPSGMLTNRGYFNGGVPVDPNDASRYYDETLRQMRSLGMNSVFMVNVDVIGVANDGHLKALVAKANDLGNIYAIPMSRAIRGLMAEPGSFGWSESQCHNQTEDSPIEQAVKTTLAATVESCTDRFGADTGVFCNSYLCARSNMHCCGVFNTCTRKPASQALAGFVIQDEPGEACWPLLRQVSKHLGRYDPAHSGVSDISSMLNPQYTGPSNYRGVLADKMLANDHVLYDDQHAFVIPLPNPPPPIGDVFTLERWAGRIDDHYVLAPADKPLYYVIQSGSDCCIRKQTPEEIRYLTYTALARGVRGVFYYLYGAQPLPAGAGGPADTDYNLDETGREIRRLGPAIRTLAPWLVDASRDMPRKNGRQPIATAMRTDNNEGSEGAPYDLDITSFTTRSGERLVMLVNEQMGAGDPATIPYHVTVDPGTAAALFAKGSVTVRDVLTNTIVGPGPITGPPIVFSSTLSQGEGKLFHLQSDFSAEVSISRDSYHNPVAAPKPIKVQVRLKNSGAQLWTTSGANTTRLKIRVYAPDGTQSEILGLSLGGNVAPGQATTVTVSIPTGAGTSITQTGTYELGFDLYKSTNNVPFKNEQRISVMVVPAGKTPLLVDTFDPVPFGSRSDMLHKWNRTGLMKIRADKLAINGGNAAVSHWGASWANYTLELDVMIDLESQHAAAQAGWMLRAAAPNTGFVFILHASDADFNPNKISGYTMNANGFPLPAGTLDIPFSIERGRWYHIKQVVSGGGSTIVTTQINPVSPYRPPVSLGPFGIVSSFVGGGVGFYLSDQAYSSTGCPGETIGRCSGGPVANTPCVADLNCLGGSCQGEVDNCYAGLARGHFDNVFVYETSAPPPAPAVTGLSSSSPSYPLTLRWNRPEGSYSGDAPISHYRVYRGANCSFTPSAANLVAEPASTMLVERTAGTFCYKVTAVTFANSEGPSSTGVTGQALSPPTAPSLSVTVNHMKSVSLTWSAISSATKYHVYRGAPGFTPSAENLIATVAAPSTSYEDAPPNMYVSDTQLGLTGFATYRYAVVPVPADGITNPLSVRFSSDVTLPGSKIFSDGFDGAATKWAPSSGTWAVSGSAYTQSSTSCAGTNGHCTSRLKGSPPLEWPRMADVSAEFTAQIVTDAGTSGNPGFAGMTIRKTNTSDQYGGMFFSGYLVYIQGDGTVAIRSIAGGGPVVSKATGLSAMAPAKRRVRVDASGPRLRVYVDGTKYIDYTDVASTWSAGYMDLTTYRAHVQYHDVNVFFREGFSDLATGVEFDKFTCPSGPACNPPNWVPLSGNWLNTYVFPNFLDTYLEESDVGDVGVISYANPVSDARIEFTVKVTNSGGSNLNWVGMTIRKSDRNHRFGAAYSGYLIFYRVNGEVVIFNPIAGVMASGSAPPPTSERKVWIQAEEGTIKVFVGDPTDPQPPLAPVVQATDTAGQNGAPRWSSGWVDFTTYAATAEFRKLSISRFLPNWRITSTYGTYDPRWMHQLMLPAPAGQGFVVSPNELKVADFTADFAVRIDDYYGVSSRWAAFSFRKTNQTDTIFTSGYMVALRGDGQLFLYGAPPMGGLGSCMIPLPTSYQQIRVRAQGSTIQVYANGSTTPCISVTNATAWPSGYVDLAASETIARFEYLQIY